MKKLLAVGLFCLSANAFASVDVTAKVLPQQGFINQYIYVTSNHTVHIVNNTDKAQTYTYSYRLCPYDEECRSTTKRVTLQPGQQFNDAVSLHQNALYHRSGHFPALAATGVSGETNAYQEGNGDISVH